MPPHRYRSDRAAPQQLHTPEMPRPCRRGHSTPSRFRSAKDRFDRGDIFWPHDAPDLDAILEIDEGRPEFHLEGTSEGLALPVFDLDVPHGGTLAQRRGDISLRSLAIAAPARAEFDDGGLR